MQKNTTPMNSADFFSTPKYFAASVSRIITEAMQTSAPIPAAILKKYMVSTQADMTTVQTRIEDALANLMKQRTILNVRKKKRKKVYDALADVDALAQAKRIFEDGLSGMEAEYARYLEAEAVLERCPTPRERLLEEKAGVYEQLAQVNREIRAARKKLTMCQEIQNRLPQMEQAIEKIESKDEVKHDERRRR